MQTIKPAAYWAIMAGEKFVACHIDFKIPRKYHEKIIGYVEMLLNETEVKKKSEVVKIYPASDLSYIDVNIKKDIGKNNYAQIRFNYGFGKDYITNSINLEVLEKWMEKNF